jgi:hypothetical protein
MEVPVASLKKLGDLRVVAPVLSAFALFLGGCDERKECVGAECTAGASSSSSSGTGGGGGSGGGVDVGSLVALNTITFSPDLSSRVDSIQFADKLSVDGKVDATRTIELTSLNSTLWPSKNQGEMFLADAGTGTVIKYGLATDGTVEEKGKIGFAAYGVNAFYWTLIAMPSPTKAFLFDEITLQGFLWDPSAMMISKNVDLSGQFNTQDNGKTYTVWREIQTLEVGGKYFAAYHYFDPATAVILPRSGMMIMNPENDSFTVVEHPTCGGLHNSVMGSDGKIYSASGVIAAAAHFAGVPGSTCIARFDPATMQWDATYNHDLGPLVGAGEFVGGLFKNNADPNAPIYVRHLIAAGVPAGLKNPLQIAGAPLWETWKLDDVTNPVAATKTDAPNAGGIIYPFDIGGKTYVSDAAIQQGKSWLVDLSVDPPARALEVSGWGYYGVTFH